MRKFLIIWGAFLIGQTSFAIDIVYPKKTNVKINSSSTFFVGSADPNQKFTINGELVDVHNSGGFAHVVKLEDGENNFELISGDEIVTFTINKPQKILNKNICLFSDSIPKQTFFNKYFKIKN